MDRMFEETFVRPSLRNGGAEGTRAAGLPIDLYETDDAHGAMTRSITLPTVVEADEAEATFRNGELTLELPKAEEVKPRSIKVKSVG
jgi:HSP20 family protein